MRGSWFDAFLAFFDRWPWPRFVTFVGATIVIALPLHAAELLDGRTELRIHGDLLVGAATLPLFAWVALVLNGVAVHALDRLRPALDPSGTPEAEIAADLIRTPNALAVPAFVLGILGGVSSVLQSPGNWSIDLAQPGARLAAAIAVSVLTDILLFGLLGHVLHQLRVVSRVHRDSVRIDVFRLEPLYAFSTLTAWTGIGLIGMVVGLIAALSATSGTFIVSGASDLALTATIFGVAIACFVAPLVGLHGRIADAKGASLADAHATLATLIREVRARVVAGELEGAGKLKDAMTAAESSVAAVQRISAWPWRPETFRGFISAIGLPIIVWTITQVLLRLLPKA